MQLDAPKSVQPDFRIRKTRAYALLHLLTHPCFAHLEVDCNRTGRIIFMKKEQDRMDTEKQIEFDKIKMILS